MKALIPILICSFLFIGSCKDKEEDSAEPYSPLAHKIIGNWALSSTTDNNNQSTSTYPANLDPLMLEFKSDSRLSIDGPCNSGGANQYLLTESGGFQLNGLSITQFQCIDESNVWEGRLVNGLNNAYHAILSGSTLKILTDGNYSLTLSRQ